MQGWEEAVVKRGMYVYYVQWKAVHTHCRVGWLVGWWTLRELRVDENEREEGVRGVVEGTDNR